MSSGGQFDNDSDSDEGHLYDIESHYSQETETPQKYGLVYCWDKNECQCEFHEAVRSGSWRDNVLISNVRHYPNGPVHYLFAKYNECTACDAIKRDIHDRRKSPDCPCYVCTEAVDDDFLTDCSEDTPVEEDIFLSVRPR